MFFLPPVMLRGGFPGSNKAFTETQFTPMQDLYGLVVFVVHGHLCHHLRPFYHQPHRCILEDKRVHGSLPASLGRKNRGPSTNEQDFYVHSPVRTFYPAEQ